MVVKGYVDWIVIVVVYYGGNFVIMLDMMCGVFIEFGMLFCFEVNDVCYGGVFFLLM